MDKLSLCILKPDAVKANLVDKINQRFIDVGLDILCHKSLHITTEEAKTFYYIHADKFFYDELCNFLSSGPIVVQVLKGEGAVLKSRAVIGATDPQKAIKGTIRGDFGTNMPANVVHGSDSPANAIKEIAFFFSSAEIELALSK